MSMGTSAPLSPGANKPVRCNESYFCAMRFSFVGRGFLSHLWAMWQCASQAPLSSRRQTLEHEARYRTWVLDTHGEYQECLDEPEDEDEHDLQPLLRSTAEDSDGEE